METLKVKLNSASNFTLKEKEKLERCCVKLEVIVNHPDFKEMFLKQDFHGETSDWGYKTNEEIYNHFRTGSEELNGQHDAEIDIDITRAIRSRIIRKRKER